MESCVVVMISSVVVLGSSVVVFNVVVASSILIVEAVDRSVLSVTLPPLVSVVVSVPFGALVVDLGGTSSFSTTSSLP